jgi:hypothetical protein
MRGLSTRSVYLMPDRRRSITMVPALCPGCAPFCPDRHVGVLEPVLGVVRDGKLAHLDGLNLSRAWMLEGIAADAEAILTGFLGGFRRHTQEPRRIVDDYRAVCDTLGRRVRAAGSSGGVIEGVASDIDSHGGLVLDRDGSRQVVAFGEVVHLV